MKTFFSLLQNDKSKTNTAFINFLVLTDKDDWSLK